MRKDEGLKLELEGEAEAGASETELPAGELHMTSWNVCKYRTSPRIPRCFVKKAFAPPPKSYPMTLLLTAVWLSDTRSRTRPTPLTMYSWMRPGFPRTSRLDMAENTEVSAPSPAPKKSLV